MGVQNGVAMAFSVLYLPLVREFGEGRAVVATVQSAWQGASPSAGSRIASGRRPRSP